MKVINPLSLALSNLISSTATETVAAWASGTTYALGAAVHYGDSLYQSASNGNLGNTPGVSALWTRTGPTNQFAMFDGEVSTQTTGAGPLSVVFEPGLLFDSFALLEVDAASVEIIITDGADGPELYRETVPLDASVVESWYDYFFAPIQLTRQAIRTGLEVYATSRVTLIFNGDAVACGVVSVGSLYEIGRTLKGSNVGIRDYSVKETDEFGGTRFVRRAYSKRMDAQALVDNADIDALADRLAALRATPCVWIGSDRRAALTVYGFYRDFNEEIAYANHSLLRLEIEGLT